MKPLVQADIMYNCYPTMGPIAAAGYRQVPWYENSWNPRLDESSNVATIHISFIL